MVDSYHTTAFVRALLFWATICLKYGRHYRIQQEKHFINSEFLFNTPGMCIFSYFIRSCNRLAVCTSYENSNDNPERHNNKNAWISGVKPFLLFAYYIFSFVPCSFVICCWFFFVVHNIFCSFIPFWPFDWVQFFRFPFWFLFFGRICFMTIYNWLVFISLYGKPFWIFLQLFN